MIEAIIIIIAIIWGFISTFGTQPLISLKEGVLKSPEPIQQETDKETSGTVPHYNKTQNTQIQQPTLGVATKIVYGPEDGEIINETNEVTFEFDWKNSSQDRENSQFETKVEGFDNDWVSSYSEERTITLPAKPKEYTFMVRERGQTNQTPAKRTFKINVSPYFEKIEIENIQTQTVYQPSLITLETDLEQGETINMTGWQIKDEGGSFIIPGGIEKYNPYYNPVPSEGIFVKQGDRIYLSGASNPLGRGRNFRPNKCLGYLANYHDFPIALSRNCPTPKREEISHLQPCCQEFILGMEKCETPNYSINFRISSDSECISYLNENFNYGGCLRNYSRDEDLIMENWHIYMNTSLVVSNDCDVLYLRDENNLFVDKYTYGKVQCDW